MSDSLSCHDDDQIFVFFCCTPTALCSTRGKDFVSVPVLAARKEMGGETSRIQQMVDEEFQKLNVTKN